MSEKLRQSEEKFRLLVEGVRDYAIFMLDIDGNVITWNNGAQKIKGYTADEIVGRHFSTFYPQEALDRGLPGHELAVARVEGRFEDEGWRLKKDGTRFWANVVITALFDPDGRLLGFGKVTRDLTERKRLEDLEVAARRMTEFLAMLAHELRNPLAPVRNVLGILRAKDLHDPELEWARDVIDRQVSHLTRLVDDLLDVGRITSGKIKLQPQPVDLAVAVARAVEAVQPMIDERKHVLAVSIPDEAPWVEGDLTRLVQVVQNLLHNAAKYTPEGGKIDLAVERRGNHAAIRVRDTGIGISSEMKEKVFELFIQGDGALARSEGGLGVGLTLVRHLVDLHGGTIDVFSKGIGQGSEFVVRLPCLERGAERVPEGGDASRAESRGRRVLVVDDNRDAALSLALLLELWGHEVRSAFDGPGALDSANEFRPDVVLLDIGLPGMTGYDVAKRLRESAETKDVTLVAMTGYGQEEDRRRAIEVGFDHHLVKPVEPPALQELIASIGKA